MKNLKIRNKNKKRKVDQQFENFKKELRKSLSRSLLKSCKHNNNILCRSFHTISIYKICFIHTAIL